MKRVAPGLLVAVLALSPRTAFACPVCFGQNDSPMAHASNLSILVMLGITGCVLAGFATFFIYLIRRARAAADAAGAQARRYADTPQEGTV